MSLDACCGDPGDCICPGWGVRAGLLPEGQILTVKELRESKMSSPPVAPGESLVGSRNLRDRLVLLRGEVDCRIEHGAGSGGHLEYVRGMLDEMLWDEFLCN